MKKSRVATILLTSAVALYLLIWIGGSIYAANQSQNNRWLVEKLVNPTVGLGHLNDDDWCALLARPNFKTMAISERVSIAEKKFDDIKGVAEEIGYDLKALKSWFQKTATSFEKYPIKTFTFAENAPPQYYRDLKDSGFPKASTLQVFGRYLFDKSTMGFALIALPFIIIPLALVFGVIALFVSKNLGLKWKLVVAGLIAIGLAEAWIINYSQKQPVTLGTFSFFDNGNYVTAEGTWTSDTNLGEPLQVSKLDCWENWGHCIESNARVSNGYLRVYTDYWELAEWSPTAITSKDRSSALCVNESLRIDRKNKVVTFTRATKDPKPDSCAGIQDEPIVMHLADGIKTQYKKS